MSINPRFRLYSTPQTYSRLVVDSILGRTALGDDLAKFEAAVKDYSGSPYTLCMPQARVGIFMSIRALIQPGQKVVCSPYTIFDVVNMVVCAGGKPVFADIDRETCNVNIESVKKLIDGQTGAVLVTHMHGLALDLRELAEFCRQKNVPLIEDAAQALGAKVAGRHAVGTMGDVGVYSFGLYKNVNAFYGGMVLTRRKELHDKLRAEMATLPAQRLMPLLQKAGYGIMTEMLTWPPFFRMLPFHVFRYAYVNDVESLNRRVREENNPHIKRTIPPRYLRQMRPVQARLGLKALSRVATDAATRQRFARMYHEGLSDVKELLLPPWREDGSHVYLQFPIQYSDRKALVKHMMRMGCDVAVQHFRNYADVDCFSEFHRDCPNSRVTADQVVVLPTYPKYHGKAVDQNIRAVRAFFGKETSKAPAAKPAQTTPARATAPV